MGTFPRHGQCNTQLLHVMWGWQWYHVSAFLGMYWHWFLLIAIFLCSVFFSNNLILLFLSVLCFLACISVCIIHSSHTIAGYSFMSLSVKFSTSFVLCCRWFLDAVVATFLLLLRRGRFACFFRDLNNEREML